LSRMSESSKPEKEVGTSRPVPESVFKKRKTREEIRAKRAANLRSLREKGRNQRKVTFKRPEDFVKEHRSVERSLNRLRQVAKTSGHFFREPDKLVFVVRTHGMKGMDRRTKKILNLLRLRQQYNGVFMKLNNTTYKMLRLVDSYVTYGTPNLKSVRELIYKRGYLKMNGQRTAMTDNRLVEQQLGEYGVVCVEDIIHEISTLGPHFKQVNQSLWPFKLTFPGDISNNKIKARGTSSASREDNINSLITKVN